MVSLDRKQRSAVFSFWRRVFLCLTIFAVTYISVIRPTQKWITNEAFFPMLPFNGHILLALTLLIASGNKNFIRFLVIYQVLLFFIIPLLGWLLINGQNWLSVVLNFHEKAHKAAFLIMGLLSIKSKADSVSAGKILNK